MSALLNDLSRLIRARSVATESDANLARIVGGMFRRGGFKVSYQKTRTDRKLFVNVIGIKGPSRGRPLLLCSHLDTVPPGPKHLWTRTGGNPWKAVCRGGKVYGLGAADDKGPLLAMIRAAGGIDAQKLKRPLVLMGTFGEESGMGGAELFTRSWKGPKPVMAIAGEPTGLSVTYRHKGMGVLEVAIETKTGFLKAALSERKTVKFKGRQAHSSRPWLGTNALDKMVRHLAGSGRGRNLFFTHLAGGHAANLIPGAAEMTVVRAKTHPVTLRRDKNAVPVFPARVLLDCHGVVQGLVRGLGRKRDRTFYPPVVTSNFGVARIERTRLTLIFDFRLLPGISMGTIYRTLRREMTAAVRRHKGLRARFLLERDNPPLDLDLKHPVTRFARRLLEANRLPVRLSVKPSCTEAGLYSRWGVPAIVLGPGEATGNIHAPNEHVALGEVERAIEVYRSAIATVCGAG